MHHPTAQISSSATIGPNVKIGAFTIVHDNVVIGANSSIGSHCEIGLPSARAEGQPLVLGEGSLIRSHSIFYEGSTFGPNLVTGHRVTVREKTMAGNDVQIGTLSDIQGECSIGNYVRTHSNVHISIHSTIGNYVWLFPYVVFTNDRRPPSATLTGATIEDYAVIATMTVVLPGVRVGQDAFVGAHSSVSRDVSPNMIAVGSPAKEIGPTSRIKLKGSENALAYPWRRHFHRGYPDDVVEKWQQEFPDG